MWWQWINKGRIIEFFDIEQNGQAHTLPALQHYRRSGLKTMAEKKRVMESHNSRKYPSSNSKHQIVR